MNCDKRNKCAVENRFVKPCFNLEETLGDWHQIGLSIFTLTSRETGLSTRSGVVLRSGHVSKSGVLINFCPFCGEHISTQFEEQEPKGCEEANK